jgi:RHS repeat-associated protein
MFRSNTKSFAGVAEWMQRHGYAFSAVLGVLALAAHATTRHLEARIAARAARAGHAERTGAASTTLLRTASAARVAAAGRGACPGFVTFLDVPGDTLDATPSDELTRTIVVRYGIVPQTGGPSCFTWSFDETHFRLMRNGASVGGSLTHTLYPGARPYYEAQGTVAFPVRVNDLQAEFDAVDDDGNPVTLADSARVVAWTRYGLAASASAGNPDTADTDNVTSLQFHVRNDGRRSITALFTCTDAGALGCGLPSVSQATIASGDSTAVSIAANSVAKGTGAITLHATRPADDSLPAPVVASATDSLQVKVTRLSLALTAGERQARAGCATVGAGVQSAVQCGDLVFAHVLPGYRTRNVLRQPTLLYNSATAAPAPVLSIDHTTFAGEAASTFRVKVFRQSAGGADSVLLATRWFNAAGVDGSSLRTRRFSLPIDAPASGLGTGIHPVRAEVLRRVAGKSGAITTADSTSATTTLLVVDRRLSPFGAGWWLAGIERLYPSQPGGRVLLVGADGSAVVFTPNGSGGYSAPPGEYSILAAAGSGFVRTLPGNRVTVHYRSSGLPDSVKDNNPSPNRARYVWAAAGPEGVVLDSVIDSRGKAITFGRDGNGRVTSIQVPSVSTVSLKQRTQSGGLVTLDTIVDPDGFRTVLGYDGATARMTTSRARRSGRFVYAYDTTGRVAQVTPPGMTPSPAPTRAFLAWQRSGAAATGMGASESSLAAAALRDTVAQHVWWTRNLIEPGTNVIDHVRFKVGASWAPDVVATPDGNATAFDRDSAGQPVRVRTLAGADVRQQWDARGNLTRSIQVVHGTSWTSRNVTRQDTTAFEYDSTWNSITRIVPPNSLEAVRFTYDTFGRRDTVINARGYATVFTYFNDGQLAQVREPSPATGATAGDSLPTVFQYDIVSGNLTFTGKGGRGPTYVYDTLHRSDVLRVEGPDATTTFTYDALKRLTRSDGKGERVDLEYRDTTFQLRRQDALGATTTVTYDSLGRVVSECRPGGQCFGTTYGDGINPTALTKPGVTTHRRYDARGLLAWEGPYGDTARFAYDAFGRMRLATNRISQVERMYDTYGRLTCEQHRIRHLNDTLKAMRVTARHDFDRSGRRQRTYLAGDRGLVDTPCTGRYAQVPIEHENPEAADPMQPGTWQPPVMLPAAADSVVVREDTLGYAYDRNGNLTDLYHAIFAKGHSDLATWSWSYDAKDRVRQLRLPTVGSATNVDWTINGMDDVVLYGGGAVTDTLQYDAAGRVYSRGSGSGHRRFTYDLRARLDSEVVNTGLARRNVYDALGNIAVDGTSSFSYDSTPTSTHYGRLLARRALSGSDSTKYGYDTRGNLLKSGRGTWVFNQTSVPLAGDRVSTYDARDRMLADTVTRMNTACFEPGTRSEPRRYRYDALGRRVMLISTDPCADDRGVWRYFWLDDHQAVKLFNFAGEDATPDTAYADETWPQPGTFGSWYVHGPGTDNVLGMWNPGTNPPPPVSARTRFIFLADHRGSVRKTYCGTQFGEHQNACNPFTTGSQDYSAYGSAAAPVAGQPGYNGQESTGGLVYMRNRWYDPNTGRFTQEDPIGYAGGSNLYAYAGNDPVNHSDPFGLSPDSTKSKCPAGQQCVETGPGEAQPVTNTEVGTLPAGHTQPIDAANGVHARVMARGATIYTGTNAQGNRYFSMTGAVHVTTPKPWPNIVVDKAAYVPQTGQLFATGEVRVPGPFRFEYNGTLAPGGGGKVDITFAGISIIGYAGGSYAAGASTCPSIACGK